MPSYGRTTEVRQIGRDELGLFISLPFRLYRGDPNWVAPLLSQQRKSLTGEDNKFVSESEHAFFVGARSGRPVSRVMVAINRGLSEKQGTTIATFSLLEGEDEEAMHAVIMAAERWASSKGARRLIGPWSPTNGEDGIGLMVQGFDDPPVILNSYNKQWYSESLEAMGYSKLSDFVGYEVETSRLPMESLEKATETALQRADVMAGMIDMSRLEEELKDIHSVMAEAFQGEWFNDMPTYEEFRKLAGPLAKLAFPELVWLARDRKTLRLVAFIVTIPDWNQVLRLMRGRLLPFGWVHMIGAKKKVSRVRLMMQYCLKEYQGSSVIPALYAKVVENAMKMGIHRAEASVILETNSRSRRAIERIGGRLSRVYRWYAKDL